MTKATPGMSAADELALLDRQLRHHDQRYYGKAEPEITDQQYDELRDRYLALADQLGIPADQRYSQQPGDDRTPGFATVRHRVPMLSLDKGYSLDDLQRFERSARRLLDLAAEAPLPVVVDPKIDGMSLSVLYQDGQLARAVSRGNGVEGDDITAQVAASGAVPLTLRGVKRGEVEVRGELYLPRAAFERLNAELGAAGDRLLVNPRNGCAGLMKRKDPEEVAGKGVRSFLYQVAFNEGVKLPDRHFGRLDWLRERGLPVNPDARLVDGVAAAHQYCQDYLVLRPGLDHDIDGMVIKIDDLAHYDQLGFTSHHPRWGIAF